MPRGKPAPKPPSSDDKKQAKTQDTKTQDNTVNGEELTMPQLQNMINDLAAKMFEKKKKELKEEIEAEMEDEFQYRLLNQFGELEEMIDNVKEEADKAINKLKTQIEKCNKAIQNQSGQASEQVLKQQLESAVKGVEDVASENKRLKRRIEKMEFKISSRIPRDITKLNTKFDEFEQLQYVKNVQIVSLPENENQDDDKQKIVKIARDTFGMNLKLTDIDSTHRMGKRKPDSTKHRDTIVKFVKKSTRDKFYENRKLTITNEDPKLNIYVNDHLTHHRQHLLYVARKLYKAKKVYAAWSQAGNILIRKIEGGPVTPINSHDDLAEFQQRDEEEDSLGSDTDLETSDFE